MGYIYCITNLKNNKKYIGKTIYSITKRFQEHCRDSKKERVEKRPLYEAMNKYGIENFVIEQLLECDNEELNSYEILFIEKFNTYKNGYNATKGGDGTILFNYKKIIDDYTSSETATIVEIARLHKCSIDTVSHVLDMYNIPKHDQSSLRSKKIEQWDLEDNYCQTFNSIAEATTWLVDHKYLKEFSRGAKQKLTMCAQGKRKTAYKFRWKYPSKATIVS